MKKKKEKIDLQRVYEKPITVFGKQLKITRVLLIAGVFALYCGMMFFETNHKAFLILGLLPVIVLVLGFILTQKRIIYFGEYSFECSNAGDLFLTILKGTCPKCKGELKIEKKGNKSIVKCKNNSEHTWNLDEKDEKRIN